MSAARTNAEKALNAIAADIPLVDRQDLTVLTGILDKLEPLASQRGLPRAFKAMAARAAKLAEHVIMGETDFDAGVKKLAEQKFPFFKGIKETDIAVANLSWFFNHFNSITLRDPLILAFDEIHSYLKDLKDTQFGKDRVTFLYQ